MYIPVVPHFGHTTVINKTIVYSDTVLNLNNKGKDLKITSIENINEYNLEECLKIIFESNNDVVFNTVQYSKNDKKVYFYTNKEISTKAWEDNKTTKYSPLTSSTQILEEIKNVLQSNKIKDTDCISIYDVFKVCAKRKYDEISLQKYYQYKLQRATNRDIILYSFDYDNKELSIGVKWFGDYTKIVFSKRFGEFGDLYIKRAETAFANNILYDVSDVLYEAYDKALSFKNFYTQSNFNIKAINSNFLVHITKNGVDVTDKKYLDYKFNLCCFSERGNYKCECNSSKVNDAIRNYENEIFKKIFIKIEDCPEWMQQELYAIRQNQLDEEQKIEDKEKYKQYRKQKRLELTRKIFPFLNK